MATGNHPAASWNSARLSRKACAGKCARKLGVVALVFRAKITVGDLAASDEATAFRWASADQVRELATEAHAVRVLDALTDEQRPVIRAHDGTRLV
jgi:hypothetical protein